MLKEVRLDKAAFTLRDVEAVIPHVNRSKVEILFGALREAGVPE